MQRCPRWCRRCFGKYKQAGGKIQAKRSPAKEHSSIAHCFIRLPCAKGAPAERVRDCFYYHFAGSFNRQYVYTIPPTRLRRATSLYTREAFDWRRANVMLLPFAQRGFSLARAYGVPLPLAQGGFLSWMLCGMPLGEAFLFTCVTAAFYWRRL